MDDNVLSYVFSDPGKLMFGWLKGRQHGDRELQDNSLRAAAQRETRAKVNRALSSAGVQLAAEPDNAQYCIRASAAIVRIIVKKAGFSMHALDNNTQFVTGIFGFVASDYLSRVVDAPFEIVSSIVVLDLLGTDYADQVSGLGDSYNRMAQSGRVIEAIGQNIAKWISIPTDEQLERLADLFTLCQQYV